MKLVSLWHWWSFALLFLNIGVSLAVLGASMIRGSLPRLSLLRVYAGFWGLGGLLQFVAACITPLGSLLFWNVTVYLSIAFDLIFFLLCVQIVDHLIKRDDVQRVKRLWLLGLPVVFVIGIVSNRMEPGACLTALLSFDALAAVVCGATILATYITPDNDWLSGYGLVIAGTALQAVAMPSLRLIDVFFQCTALDIASPMLSLVTLTLFLLAATIKTKPLIAES